MDITLSIIFTIGLIAGIINLYDRIQDWRDYKKNRRSIYGNLE